MTGVQTCAIPISEDAMATDRCTLLTLEMDGDDTIGATPITIAPNYAKSAIKTMDDDVEFDFPLIDTGTNSVELRGPNSSTTLMTTSASFPDVGPIVNRDGEPAVTMNAWRLKGVLDALLCASDVATGDRFESRPDTVVTIILATDDPKSSVVEMSMQHGSAWIIPVIEK